MSSSGQYQTAVIFRGTIYYNSSYGQGNWTQISAPLGNFVWYAIAMSSSGQYQTAVVNNGTIYYNSSYGQGNWTAISAPLGNFYWYRIAMSSSGQYQTAIIDGGTIYYNSNYGLGNWTAISSPTANFYWNDIAMSSSGQYQTAIIDGGTIYYNSNYGQGNWTEISVPNTNWHAIAMSSSGQYISTTNLSATNYLYVTPYPNNSNQVTLTLSATGSTGPTGGTNLFVNASIVPTTGFQYSLGFSGPDGSGNSLIWDNVYANNVFARSNVFANNIQLTSDYRIKNNVKQLDDTFTVKYLKPISYTNKQTNTNDIGLIAHELQEHYPELVTGNKDGPELQTINYNGLIQILINKIKSIRNRIEILEEEEDDDEEENEEENKKVEDILSNDNVLKK
jgi:hypothetical protein